MVTKMASTVMYGPLQLLVIGFGQAALPLDFVNQLRRVRDDGIVRLVDAVYAAKDEHGDLTQIRVTDFSTEEMSHFGILAGALFGYGAAGDEGVVLGAVLGEMAAESREIGLDSDDMDEIADRIPRGTSAAFILMEHLWAIGLKESLRNTNGAVLASGWLTPATLIKLGEESAVAAAADNR
jgi:uncharacterized membrane protein